MEWIERLNMAVEYIENHLLEKIEYEKVAEIAGCPTYHFQRMFFYMTNISVNKNEWKYFIAVSSTEYSDRFEKYDIPIATWAVFEGRGSNVSLQDLERRVITEWLPTSGYEYAEVPDIEVYIKADPKDAIYEYWLPVVKKEDNNGCINHQS